VNILKLLLFVAVVAGGYHQWNKNKQAQAAAQSEASSSSSVSANGFISVAMPGGSKPGVVMIFAPENCPSDAAQRADHLAERLSGMGIPVQRSSHYSSSTTNATDEDRARLDRALTVLNGEIPAVFINGMGKANPSAEDVAAVLGRAR
jgi:hypothetical protein